MKLFTEDMHGTDEYFVFDFPDLICHIVACKILITEKCGVFLK